MSFLKSIWKSSSKHKKLSEECALAKGTKEIEMELTDPHDSEGDCLTFKVKYLGSTPVDKASSEAVTADAIKAILRVAKAAGRKLARVSVEVSRNGIRVTDDLSEKERMNISIFRISYCSADAVNNRVFAFIAANADETIECHAFLCPKRKTARAVTLCLARAFASAYEAWSMLPPTSSIKQKEAAATIAAITVPDHQLIDLGDFADTVDGGGRPRGCSKTDWVSFDDEETFRWNENKQIDLMCS